MNKLIKAIFLDLDGTIINKDKNMLERETIDLLNKIQKKGVKVCIATSRPFETIKDIEDIFVFQWDGIVASFGQQIFLNNHLIFEKAIPQQSLYAIFSISKRLSIPVYAAGEKTFFTMFNDDVQSFKEMFHVQTNDIKEYEGEKIKLITLISAKKIRYEDYFSDIPNIKFVYTGGINTDLFLDGVDKFSGIQVLLNEWGLSKNQYMAFGDSNSDLSMIINARIGISMQNATDELKKAADDQCDTCQNHGVEKYLSNYFHLHR